MDYYSTYVAPMTSWLSEHHFLAGLLTFLISFSESLALVGTIVPGSVTMTAIGILVGTGVLPATPTFIWAILGAIAGDSASYFLGYYYHEKISKIWPFRKHPNIISSGTVFFKQHGGKSVFIGRFLGPLRSIIPVVAGMMRMENSKFLLANITSAVLWSFLYILPGVLIGSAASELSPHVATKIFIFILGAIAVLWALAWITRYIYQKLSNYLNSHFKVFWLWLHNHPKLEYWAKLISSSDNPRDHRQIILFLFAVLCFILFIISAKSAVHNGIITQWNKSVFHFLQSIRQPMLDSIFMFFTYLGDKRILISLLFAVFFYFVIKKKKSEAIHWLSNGLLASLLVFILKPFLAIHRPVGLVQIRHGSSFPSGHATFSIAVYGFLFYLIAKNVNPAMRRFVLVPGGTLLASIAFSRIYLGMHWLSDIMGSIFLATGVLLAHILSYQRSHSSKINIYKLSAFAFVITSIVASYFMYHGFERAIRGSQLKTSRQATHYSDWWDQTINLKIPTYRKNRFGRPVSILNVQWVMPLKKIETHLNKHGWKRLEAKKLSSRFKYFIGDKNIDLSLFHKLYQNHPPSLIMYKDGYIIRLWSSTIYFINNKAPLWLGTLSQTANEHHSLFEVSAKKQVEDSLKILPHKVLSDEIKTLKHKKKNTKNIPEILLITQ